MFVASLFVTLVLIGSPPPIEDTPADVALKDFNARVQQYWDLHKIAADAAPPIDKKKNDPHEILAHEEAVVAAIRAGRPHAVEGEIFTPAVQNVFLERIKAQLSSGTGAKARPMILGEGNPRNAEEPAKVVLAVNAKYPAKAPLSTVPPSVLLALPKLPEGLEYRFVGRHLILFDSKANLIVDILRNAIR